MFLVLLRHPLCQTGALKTAIQTRLLLCYRHSKHMSKAMPRENVAFLSLLASLVHQAMLQKACGHPRRCELQRREEGALHHRFAERSLGAGTSAVFPGNRIPVTSVWGIKEICWQKQG